MSKKMKKKIIILLLGFVFSLNACAFKIDENGSLDSISTSVENTVETENPSILTNNGNDGEEYLIPELPKYYTNSWISQRIDQVNINTDIVNGISFAFITDVHLQANQGNSKYLMKYILDKTNVPFCIFGGDVIGAFGSKETLLSEVDNWCEWVEYVGKVYQIRGNHDYTIKTSSEENTGYTESETFTYDHIMNNNESDITGTSDMYYMLDDDIHKIRFIFINGYQNITSGEVPFGVQPLIDQNQHNWIIERIKEVENYHFIIITHSCPNGNIAGGGAGAGLPAIASAINNKSIAKYDNENIDVHIDEDFTNTTNDIICFISGHNHRDDSDIKDGVLYITTTCDATYNNDPLVIRTSGTVSEQAFDVFTIDIENRIIKTVRFGGGSNRTWKY